MIYKHNANSAHTRYMVRVCAMHSLFALALKRVIFLSTTNKLRSLPCAILLLLFYYIISLRLFSFFSLFLLVYFGYVAYQMIAEYIFATTQDGTECSRVESSSCDSCMALLVAKLYLDEVRYRIRTIEMEKSGFILIPLILLHYSISACHFVFSEREM